MTRAAINFGAWSRIATMDATSIQVGVSVIFLLALRFLQVPNMRPLRMRNLLLHAYILVSWQSEQGHLPCALNPDDCRS